MSRYPERTREPPVYKDMVNSLEHALVLPPNHPDYWYISPDEPFTAKEIKECPSLAGGPIKKKRKKKMSDKQVARMLIKIFNTVADRSEGGKNDLDLGPANNGAGRQTPFAHGMCLHPHYRPSPSCY
jgi:hypothetical protein